MVLLPTYDRDSAGSAVGQTQLRLQHENSATLPIGWYIRALFLEEDKKKPHDYNLIVEVSFISSTDKEDNPVVE